MEQEINYTQCLYRHFADDGSLLYIGITGRIVHRTMTHFRSAPWEPLISRIEVERFSTRFAVLLAEKMAIQTEKPRYNQQHNASHLRELERLELVREAEMRRSGLIRHPNETEASHARRLHLRQCSLNWHAKIRNEARCPQCGAEPGKNCITEEQGMKFPLSGNHHARKQQHDKDARALVLLERRRIRDEKRKRAA